jgi:hypothetical protein
MENITSEIEKEIEKIGEKRFNVFRKKNIEIISSDEALKEALLFYKTKDLNSYSTILSIICNNMIENDLIETIKSKSIPFNYDICIQPHVLIEKLKTFGISTKEILEDNQALKSRDNDINFVKYSAEEANIL